MIHRIAQPGHSATALPAAAIFVGLIFSSCSVDQEAAARMDRSRGAPIGLTDEEMVDLTPEELWQMKPAQRRAYRRAARERIARERVEEGGERPEARDRRRPGGLFGGGSGSAGKYKSPGHYIHVDEKRLPGLHPGNSSIEIDLSDQRARVFKREGGTRELVIETQIASGKPGHTTPTGNYKITEKKVEKRSNIYGTWVDGNGEPVAEGTIRKRPSGAAEFVGADMPYWMRFNGPIGMHIGYVPDGPASHGCVRFPEAIHPLIFSKVKVGTPVEVSY